MPEGDPLTVKAVQSLADVPAAGWDACAGSDNPTVSHAFLSALEDSGSATAESGWLGQHLVIEDAAGDVIACAPLYLKSHSYGEYVFDWGWADAYERAGGRYYPKLQGSVPFTPVSGPRLMVRPDVGAARAGELRDALGSAMVTLAERLGASSVHVTFPPEQTWRRLVELGYLERIGQQFHWHNRGYADFDDFLGALNSRKRKAIRKERREVAETGLRLRALTGPDIEPRHWDAFYRFYLSTIDKKWGPAYLTREFFSLLAERMAEQVVLMVAEKPDGTPVAGALNLLGADTLYGRNWGCSEEYRFLHFECCYYLAIEYAIAHGLARVEAGAQGPHKIQRGYLPEPTYSAHWIADPGLRDAIADYLAQERRGVRLEMAALAEESPYRKAPPGD